MPTFKADVIKTHSSTKLLKRDYGYISKTSVSEGVNKFISWYLHIMVNTENNTLLLIDLSKNFDFIEKNKKFINLNKGQIHLKNCKKIKLKVFQI